MLDIEGRQINIGDRVAYGVKNRYATLQVGTVEAFVPYVTEGWVANPGFNPNIPETFRNTGAPNGNPRWIWGDVHSTKIKVREDDKHYKDANGIAQVFPGKSKTLDNPKRFAVVGRV